MPGVISVRFTKEERQEIRRRYREQGFPTLSAYVRTRLGFDPAGGIDSVVEYDELSTEGLLKSHVEVRDRVDQSNTLLKQIARHLGIHVERLDDPRPYTHVPAVAPPDPEGNVDIPTVKQENTHAMPAGFER